MSVAIVLALAAIPAVASAAIDAYLKIDGVPGESKDVGHQDWIEVSSFSFGGSHGGAAEARGGGAGKVAVHDISITKKIDKASPTLFRATTSGRHFPTVTLEARRSGEAYLTYTLEDVMITGVHVSGDRETVTLSYARLTTTSRPTIERSPVIERPSVRKP
jgi:type VI secretion system secreted protein Hcp